MGETCEKPVAITGAFALRAGASFWNTHNPGEAKFLWRPTDNMQCAHTRTHKQKSLASLKLIHSIVLIK